MAIEVCGPHRQQRWPATREGRGEITVEESFINSHHLNLDYEDGDSLPTGNRNQISTNLNSNSNFTRKNSEDKDPSLIGKKQNSTVI